MRMPEALERGLEAAANQQMTSKSEIVRQAVIARLKDDGFIAEGREPEAA
jgi:hypothetical protein